MERKIQRTIMENDYIITRAVSTGTIAAEGIANGRMVPAVIVEDSDGKIEKIINFHEGFRYGSCEVQWGSSPDSKEIILTLSFKEPTPQRIAILFKTLINGATIDQILYARCMYLLTGNSGDRLATQINQKKVLIEIGQTGFEHYWENIFRKQYVKKLQKENNFSKKDANQIFDKIREEVANTTRKIRM